MFNLEQLYSKNLATLLVFRFLTVSLYLSSAIYHVLIADNN